MHASPANSSSFKVTTPSDTEIEMGRLFDAPPALVFEVMTRPEHVQQWWGQLGEGYSVTTCEIDLRVGGAWRFVNKHPGGRSSSTVDTARSLRPTAWCSPRSSRSTPTSNRSSRRP